MGAEAVAPMNPSAAPTPEAAPAAQAAPGEAGAAPEVAEDLLRIPAFAGLFAGEPPALSASGQEMAKRPEGKLIQENVDGLKKMGIGLYRSIGGDVGVLFNQFYISGEELKAADEAGKLQEVAPPFDAVNQQVAGMGQDQHPAAKKRQQPQGFKTAPAPAPPQMGSPVTAPAPATPKDIKAQQARMKNMQPGSPTSGPKPGAGRLLNSILKPVI